PGAFISSACNENKRRGRDPSPLSFSVFRFFSPPLSFFLFLVLSACLQLLGLAFFLYPLLHREFSATSASKERRTFLLLSLFFSHLLIACLHLYRHISKCRHVLLLSSRDPPSPPILLPFYLSLTLIEMLFHLLISLPVSFLLLLPFVSILNSFSSSSSSDYGAGDGSSFFFSSFLAGPLTALFVSFPFPSLSDCYVWISSFLLSIFFHFLLLFLFAIHAQLQQYANPAESLAVSASLAQLANMSTDMSNKTQQLNQLQFTSPRQKGRSFDNLILLSRWLRDCAKALEISLFSPDTFYFKSYVRKRHEEEAERKRLSVFSSSSISSSPSPSLAGRERREGERGQDGGEEEERRRERARDVGRKTEILQTRGAVRWSQFLETNESPLTLQRERCPLVPALEEFFSDCRYDDQFPLTLVPRSYDRSFPIKKETQKAGSSFLQTSTREGEETHAGSVPRRETANLVGEVMIERKLFGSPSVFCVYYENLVLDACEYYIGVLQTLQQSQLFFSPLYDKSAPRDSSSSSSFFFSSSPCKRRYERGEDFYTNANLSSFQRQKAAADQLAFSTFASPSSSSSVRHRKKEEQEEAKEREKIQQARHRACSAVIKSKTNREEKQRQDAPSSSFSFASKVRDFAEQEEETKKKKRHALVLLFISLLSWLSSFYHICVKKPFLSFLSFLDLLDEEEEEEGESYLTREREGGLTSLEEKETREKKKRRRRSRSEKGLVYEVEQREVCVLSGVCACALEGYTLWLCLKAKVEEEEEEEEEEERRAKGPEGGRRGEEAEERREILGASTRGKKRNDLYYHPLLGDSTYSILEARRFASLDSSAAKVAVKM
ncbi:transmembrane protein, partial [Cystoisospora suis]